MSEEETNVEVSAEVEESRPQKGASRAKSGSRPKERTPVAGFRNILGVSGKDPEYVYRFVLDTDENGERILLHQQAGYELVKRNEIGAVGQARVGSDTGSGSVVRVPSRGHSETGNPTYLYLMKIHRDWYNEDQKSKTQDTIEQEKMMLNQQADENEGRYGEIKVSRGR